MNINSLQLLKRLIGTSVLLVDLFDIVLLQYT